MSYPETRFLNPENENKWQENEGETGLRRHLLATAAGSSASSMGVSCGRVKESSHTAVGEDRSNRDECRMNTNRRAILCESRCDVQHVFFLPM